MVTCLNLIWLLPRPFFLFHRVSCVVLVWPSPVATAGHGGSVRDKSGDEADNMDETLVPVDYKEAGQITDDEILKEVRLLACVPQQSSPLLLSIGLVAWFVETWAFACTRVFDLSTDHARWTRVLCGLVRSNEVRWVAF